ncbi:MarR family transcriptional regulator [Streptomyces sp. NPDC005803]|uniref:MarR family winged helix-turn-helix transcriptional regulator n=1 Tax=Streptomyces sp. NPDC005803 TaxID=3154297 RepID=UPI0033C1B283
MAMPTQFEELARQLTAVAVVRRDIHRVLPSDCPGGPTTVLTLLGSHGDMCVSKLAELLAAELSVTRRHVAYAAARGWIERLPDHADRNARLLRLTPAGVCRLDELSRLSIRLLADRLSHWTEEEVGQLIGLMARLHASFS